MFFDRTFFILIFSPWNFLKDVQMKKINQVIQIDSFFQLEVKYS